MTVTKPMTQEEMNDVLFLLAEVDRLRQELQQSQAREGAYRDAIQIAWEGYCGGNTERAMHKLKDTVQWIVAHAQGKRTVILGLDGVCTGVPKEKWPICPKCGKKELSLIHGIADGDEKYLCYGCWRELEQALTAGEGGASDV